MAFRKMIASDVGTDAPPDGLVHGYLEYLGSDLEGKQDLASVTDAIAEIPAGARGTPQQWFVTFGVGFLALMLFLYAVTYLFAVGVGIWGIDIPVAWGFAIVNFVWWIGIGHAGTLISAILLLLHQKWRTSINRFSETMTLFAVMCAGMFPLLHMGRPWFFYWLYPYPNTMGLWPQFRSPLVWDVFAVTTYFTISLVFWYVGMLPDLATMRDSSPTRLQRIIYGIFALGWRGSAMHWRRYEKVYLILAGISTPLVLSVHTVVSFDFAVAMVPLWHSTIFPPFFVAGAIFSGFAMVLVLAIPVRKWYHLEQLMTARHLDNCAKMMLATGMLVCFGYFSEFWMSWYGHSTYEWGTTKQRTWLGPYNWSYWALLFCNLITPQVLWSKRMRTNYVVLFIVSVIVLIGMWFERYVIIVTLSREYSPAMWGRYAPTFWDWATFIGTLGFFTVAFMVFLKILPMISMSEIREMLPPSLGGRSGHGIVEGPP